MEEGPDVRIDSKFVDAICQRLDTLEHILDILRGSTITEERGGDAKSKFWAMYKKVSDQYDNDFLDRANDDMAIILTFAGLLSVVTSTFIVGMKPDPGDTTNALMLQMMNIMVNGPDAVNISNLSSSTPYSSSIVWMQTLSYASLAFSLLAAFGAVLGKQWLSSYKAARVQGTLEERGRKRQKKSNGIEDWHLKAVLKAFLILLQISLFLFGMSLSANMWIQQETISIVVMCTTAFGFLFYVTTVLLSVIYPDSPFQTAETTLIVGSCKTILTLLRPLLDVLYYNLNSPFDALFDVDTLLDAAFIKRLTVRRSVRSSAIHWLLETSTNPDVVKSVATIIPDARWPVDIDTSTVIFHLQETLETYPNRQELSVKCAKAIAHFFVESIPQIPSVLMSRDILAVEDRCIRDAFIFGRDAWEQLMTAKTSYARLKHIADVRTALRRMVVHGLRGRFSHPDDSEIIRGGDLRWCRHDKCVPSLTEFDWLVDYLVNRLDKNTDDETQGDALLALSAMNGLGSDAKQASYFDALVRCMADTKPPRVRCAAVKCISDARGKLFSINDESMPRGIDAHLDKLFGALSTTVGLEEMDEYLEASNNHYSRLIFVLTSNEDWRQRLIQNGHIQQCMGLFPTSSEADIYIAGIFLHINPSDSDPSFSSIRGKLGELTQAAWNQMSLFLMKEKLHDSLEILPALVKATRQSWLGSKNDVASSELESLALDVNFLLQKLRTGNAVDGNVLSAMQSFSDDLKDKLQSQPWNSKPKRHDLFSNSKNNI